MDFEALQLALKAWVLALLGWTAGTDPVLFENEPRSTHNGRIAILSWVSGVGAGLGETRWEDTGAAAPASNLVPVVVRDEVLALQVAVECTNQLPATHARAQLTALFARVRRPSSLAALRAMNLGLVTTGTIAQADYKGAEQRMWSRCVLEVRFNATTFDRDTAGAASSIATAQVTSHITDPAGVLLPPAEQLNNVTLP